MSCVETISSVAAIVSAFCAAISLIAVVVLMVERFEKKRPYLQVSFELIRSTLACLVLRNVGNEPIALKSVVFNNDFIEQLPNECQTKLRAMEMCEIKIFPTRFWVISFDVNVYHIINNFKQKKVEINCTYVKIGTKKEYNELHSENFADYRAMLLYVSEIDEFKQSTDKLRKSIDQLTKPLN